MPPTREQLIEALEEIAECAPEESHKVRRIATEMLAAEPDLVPANNLCGGCGAERDGARCSTGCGWGLSLLPAPTPVEHALLEIAEALGIDAGLGGWLERTVAAARHGSPSPHGDVTREMIERATPEELLAGARHVARPPSPRAFAAVAHHVARTPAKGRSSH